MVPVRIYTKAHCPYCDMAKQLLAQYGATYEEQAVDADPAALEAMMAASKARTVPQIFIDGVSVGGYTDLLALHQSGDLKSRLGVDG